MFNALLSRLSPKPQAPNTTNDPLVAEVTQMAPWIGASRTTYNFRVHPIGATLDQRPGVYIFCTPAGHCTWGAYYIGECENFADSLTHNLFTHRRWKFIRDYGASHVCTLWVPDGKEARQVIETDLRHSLDPFCNRH